MIACSKTRTNNFEMKFEGLFLVVCIATFVEEPFWSGESFQKIRFPWPRVGCWLAGANNDAIQKPHRITKSEKLPHENKTCKPWEMHSTYFEHLFRGS